MTGSKVTELQELISKSGLSADTGAMIYKEFAPIASSVAELAAKAHSLVVTDATQLTEMKQAREIRLAFVKARKDAERKKTEPARSATPAMHSMAWARHPTTTS